MGKDAVMVIRGLVISLIFMACNFAYQYFGPKNWGAAFERSFFQWWALVSFVLLEHFFWRKP